MSQKGQKNSDLDEAMIGGILAMKVDKIDFSRINEDKANKTELEN